MTANFPEETARLAIVKENLHDALTKLDKRVANYETEYRESKRYLAENWNEIDGMERFSNERSLVQIENSGNVSFKMRMKIEKLVNSPYFARMDFQYDGETEAEQIYIGQFSFTDAANQILIYDWRAPISSMYYDQELGRAAYEAPMGSIEGDIVRKRQFKIKNGHMEYVLESAMNIDDDILQSVLSNTSDEKMKNIIATIQKEQNQIIRNDQAHTLVIQGVAGSGKTAIALHRVAYLLYRYKDRLSANNVAIISPNKVFADYIANVLPELGEEPIMEISFEGIAAEELSGILAYERFADHIENPSLEWMERSRFKSAPALITCIDKYLKYAEQAYFQPMECGFGRFIIPKEDIQGRYHAYGSRPIFKRFAEMAGDILNRMKTDNIQEDKLPSRNEILKKLTAMFKMKDTLALYADFYSHMEKPDMFVLTDKNKLEWPDVFPYIYFKIFVEGVRNFQAIQHLVIDEMQDYTPIQYAVINKICQCKKTILGDFGQSVNPYNLHSLDVFEHIFQRVDCVVLNKSYRSTYEIIEFAKSIQNNQYIETVQRHGDVPDLIGCDCRQAELSAMKKKVSQFIHSNYATLGILCKNSQQAKKLYEELSVDHPVCLLDADSTKFVNGITITTIFMSKGLEFDQVIIPYANMETYSSNHDRSLLYIASTRAMHKLCLSYHGSLTKLFHKPANS